MQRLPSRLSAHPRARPGLPHAATKSFSKYAHRHVALAAEIDLDALMMPDIDGDLNSIQSELGAVFDDNGIVRTFKNTRQAVDGLEAGVVLVDRSHWGRIRLTGKDRLDFLHNQSTANFKEMKPGTGCDTVFVTPTARTIDLATVLIAEKHAMLIVSPSTKDELVKRFDKYIFPADDVQVMDVSSKCCMMSLIGPDSKNVLKELGGEDFPILESSYGSHQMIKFCDRPMIVFNGSGLDAPGYTFIVDEVVAGDLFGVLALKGCILMGEDEWEVARVQAGRPSPGSELTEDYNPLEAGLYHAVSVSKGCYIGQETISKLHNTDGVRQQLWGLTLESAVPVGSEIKSNGDKVGKVTSCVASPRGGHFALGYIKCKSKGAQIKLEGTEVEVEGQKATVTSIPFATRNFLDGKLSASVGKSSEEVTAALGPGAESMARRAQEALEQKEQAAAREAAEKAERLAAMQARLAAWQAQQAPGGASEPPKKS